MKALRLIWSNPVYISVACVFASLNILIGTWAIYIPEIKEELLLSEGELGLALFFFALGTLTFIPLSPYLLKRYGPGRATGAGILFYCVAFLFPFLAYDFWSLAMALFITGAASGFTDIAMNTLVSEKEKQDDVSIMSAAHGFFSLGGVIGAGVGGILAGVFKLPFHHMLLVSLLLFVVNFILMRNYKGVQGTEQNENDGVPAFLKPLLGLAIISFIIMASEGAVVDWSGLYLQEVSSVKSTWLTGMGYTLFSVTMTVGRFLGDEISSKKGAVRLILGGLMTGIAGYLLILSADIYTAIAGFGLLGMGFSVIVPELFRMAGSFDRIPPARGISFIAGTGYLGFLSGPVALGFIAEVTGLRYSFVTLLAGAVMAFVVTLLLWARKK
ncbi:MFS transporter [Robertkochia aurantiaca]|uniref:MFS transporter n=1 Tax=Robertkochia aurantiaca TaxID=2873700 RepID=UPI001CCF9881|nr:MFS transporter [Robertkochia sp. 3YJGBD-33]